MKPEESQKLIHYAKTVVISLSLSFFITAPVLADNAPVPQDNHAYTLTKVDQAGENTITKYEWSDSENKYVPVYYRVDLNKTEYGHKNVASETKTFTITTPNADGSGNAFNYEIKYYTDANRLASASILGDQKGADIDKDFIKLYRAINNEESQKVDSTIGNISGDFIENTNAIYTTAWGNKVKIGNITGNFIANTANGFAGGAAIHNEQGYLFGTAPVIGNITGDFIANNVKNATSYSSTGGAISNINGKIGDITGDFIANYTQSGGSFAHGGAIYNYGDFLYSEIGNITGDFIANYVQSSGTSSNVNAAGGAIYNSGDSRYANIESITGDFIANYAMSANASASGGAIYSSRTSSYSPMVLNSNFYDNYVKSKGNSQGGAIYISGSATINNANFSNNYAESSDGEAKGGAIYIKGRTLNVTANNGQSVFSGNYVKDINGKRPEAIYVNSGSLNFEANKNGSILLNDIINGIDSGFALNLSGDGTGIVSFYNDIKNANVSSKNITIDFADNDIRDYKFLSFQSNDSTKLNLDLDLTSKTSDTISTVASSNGVVYINSLNFLGEENDPTVPTIFQVINNTDLNSKLHLAIGDNVKVIGYVDPNIPVFEQIADVIPTTIYNNDIYMLENGITLTTTKTYNDSLIIDKNKVFTNLLAELNRKKTTEDRSFLFRTTDSYILHENLGQTTAGTLYIKGLGIKTPSIIDANNHSLFELSNVTKLGISNILIQNAKAEDGSVINAISSFYSDKMINLENTSLKNNMSSNKGGAIYTNQGINIIAKNGGNSVFTGNYTESDGVKTPNAIYVEGAKDTGKQNINISLLGSDKVIVTDSTATAFPTITLNANTKGTIQFDDQIQGSDGTFETTIKSGTMVISDKLKPQLPSLGLDENATVSDFVAKYREMVPELQQYTDEQIIAMFVQAGYIDLKDEQIISSGAIGSYDLKITGDKTGKVILNNDVINANISLDNTNLYLGKDNVFDKSQSLTLNSGSMSMINNQAGTMNIPTLNLNGTTNLGVDVDLANKQMDTIKATNYNVAQDAKLNVNNINLLNDAKEDLTNILFTDNKNLASATAYTGASPIAYSPIYKYEVSYNPDDGFFTFLRGGGTSGNASDAFNPAVLAPSVATQAGAYTTQLQTFNYAFQHSDTFMNIPYLERTAMINQNKYALSPTGDVTDVGTFSPLLIKEQDAGFWVKPYASFENIPLNNGPKVSNINYGTLVGYDSSLTPISKGWERVLTGYIGYNGASQRYSGVDAYQNGGILGGTATLYKGNFFNATTLSVGATAGDASTMYGNENYAMLLAGVGNKTGYNFEFKDGRIILQPNFLISYTFVNTFDYTNGAGVRIKSDPLNAIQLAPGLKLIGNTKNGWQPYLSVAMVWNLLDDSKVTANDVRLPEMSIDPYIQYGAGIQKRFKDRFIAFGQAMIHNGGRNGVSLTGGIRWTVGK